MHPACHQLFSSSAALSCSIVVLYSNQSSPTWTCSLFCHMCRHLNSKISPYHSHSEITLLTDKQWINEFNTKFMSHSQLYKNWSPLVFTPFSHSKFNVILFLHLLSHVIVLLSLLVSTFQTDHSITSFLSYGMVLLLTYFMPLITPLLLQLLPALASLTFPPLTF